MRILFATSEAVPFCKTGGLADVAGSLPQALAKAGNEVAVVLPLYQKVAENWKSLRCVFFLREKRTKRLSARCFPALRCRIRMRKAYPFPSRRVRRH